MVSLPDRIVCSTEHIAAAQIDILIPAHRRHHLSGHYQLTATFTVRPCVKSDTKDPIHQTIPSDVFCPGRTKADPYMVPNDLQELIWRLQRLQGVMKLNLLPRYGHGGDIDQSPRSTRASGMCNTSSCSKFLKVRAGGRYTSRTV